MIKEKHKQRIISKHSKPLSEIVELKRKDMKLNIELENKELDIRRKKIKEGIESTISKTIKVIKRYEEDLD